MDREKPDTQGMFRSSFLTGKDIERATEAAAACDNKDCKGGPFYTCLWCRKGAAKSKKRKKRRS